MAVQAVVGSVTTASRRFPAVALAAASCVSNHLVSETGNSAGIACVAVSGTTRTRPPAAASRTSLPANSDCFAHLLSGVTRVIVRVDSQLNHLAIDSLT